MPRVKCLLIIWFASLHLRISENVDIRIKHGIAKVACHQREIMIILLQTQIILKAVNE